MSGIKNQLSKFGGIEIFTGANTMGVLYLYYELSKLGTDVNKRMVTLTTYMKRIIKNINVIDMHLKKHLRDHKTNFDIDDDKNSIESSQSQSLIELQEELLSRIRELEERVSYLEGGKNPLFEKYSSKKYVSNSTPPQTYGGKDTVPIY